MKIVDKKEQVLHTKMIPIVKVLWRNHGVEKESWQVVTPRPMGKSIN
jgi:hypothetical protein